MDQRTDRPNERQRGWSWWYILFLIQFIAVLWPPFYAGAVPLFAVPYTIMIYPILFLVFPRLWHVCRKHNYITPADFVRGRFGNRWLALAVAITGLIATMPYIALQLVGL